jgi:hypothetical protein
MSLLLRFNHLTTKKAIVNTSPAYPRGIHDGNAAGLPGVEPDLVAANIRYGETVFGILGTMVQWVYDLFAKTGKGALTIPFPTISVSNTNLNAGDGGQTSSPALTMPAPSITITNPQATIAALDAGVAHKQAGAIDTDETAATNNATANDMDILPAAGQSTGDGFYFGMNNPFDGLTINMGIAGVGTFTFTWKYWNGAWVAIPSLTQANTINNFKTAGMVNITFNRPGDWAVTNIAGLGNKYYVKAEVTFTSVATIPKGTQAWSHTY